MTREFDPSWLDLPPSERADAFDRNVRAMHPHMKAVRSALLHQVLFPPRDKLVVLVGATGTGKSTLARQMLCSIEEERKEEMKQDLSYFPAIYLNVPAYEGGRFDWKDFYKLLLEAAGEPLVDKKIHPDKLLDQARSGSRRPVTANSGVSDLRYAIQQCFHRRRVQVVFFDNAQHLGKLAGGRQLKDQMDTFKYLYESLDAIPVFLGTNELFSMIGLNEQLGRREILTYYSPYQKSSQTPDDASQFRRTLHHFQERLPVHDVPVLDSHWEYCLRGSLGLIGVLKDWLTRALSLAVSKGQRTVTIQDLRQTELAKQWREDLERRIKATETRLEVLFGRKIHELRLQSYEVPREPPKVIDPVTTAVDSPKKSSPSLKPGQRRPARDRVGPLKAANENVR